MFTPNPGEDEPILTHIFQMGWFNHQLVVVCFVFGGGMGVDQKKLQKVRNKFIEWGCYFFCLGGREGQREGLEKKPTY